MGRRKIFLSKIASKYDSVGSKIGGRSLLRIHIRASMDPREHKRASLETH